MFFEPTRVNIGFIKLNNTDHVGSVSFGSSLKLNRNVTAKKTQGFGQQNADSVFRWNTIHMVSDEEIIDNMAVKNNR